MDIDIGKIILKKEIDIGELELDVKKIGVKTGEINIDRNGQYDAVFDGFSEVIVAVADEQYNICSNDYSQIG